MKNLDIKLNVRRYILVSQCDISSCKETRILSYLPSLSSPGDVLACCRWRRRYVRAVAAGHQRQRRADAVPPRERHARTRPQDQRHRTQQVLLGANARLIQ